MTIQVSSTKPEAVSATPAERREAYLEQLLSQPPQENEAFREIRDRALTLIKEQELPSSKVEDWRFTDLTPLYKVQFQPASNTQLSEKQLTSILWDGVEHLAVFINGVFSPHYSRLGSLPSGIQFECFDSISPGTIQRISQNPGANEIFTAINSVSFSDIAAINIAPKVSSDTPIHLLFIAVADAAQAVSQYPRVSINIETGATANIIEDYVTLGEGETFTNTVAELTIGANAELKHTRIQRESKTAFHIGKTSVTQARDSRYRSVSISIGGQISRHTPEVTLLGNQTETHLDGLTLAAGTQIADTHSTIAFTTSHCTANQLHKCIIDDSARAVFNGKVFVPKQAQQTDAGQLSRNLLLSPKARVDTKPQLEIVADDVKCAHGATVSQLEEEEVFYLQSRGLDRESACDLLVEAFAAEIIEKCPIASMRQGLLQQVLDQVR